MLLIIYLNVIFWCFSKTFPGKVILYYFVCLYPIITQKPFDQFASNFNWGTKTLN